MRITKSTQLALYRKYARQALYAGAVHDLSNIDKIIDLGERRAFGSEGIEIYGDATFHKQREEKVFEGECETADRIFYWVTILAADNGDL